MSEPSAKSFLKLLERSGIVAEDRLKQALSSLSTKAAGRTINLSDLAGHLIDSGLITQWHTDKLLAGKYKGFFLGKYKLLGHLGTGGMSSVYLAQHRISEQFRAIKVLPRKKVADKSYLDRFYLEARAAASLNHSNVVRIYDICNESDTHYMVMEYVRGNDLYEIVKEHGPLDFVEAVNFTLQAAEGLIHAHERELVHRDIKPANLLKTENGDVKILDLGLALVNQEDSASLTVLYNEKVMGTADYLSPEQAVNSHNVDLRADIYSLGCTLYFLLTGHPPFPKGTLAQRIAMHQSREPADIRRSRPECPDVLVSVCQKMMHKNPDARYQNCVELQTALRKLIESGELENIPRPADSPANLNQNSIEPTPPVASPGPGNPEWNNDGFDIDLPTQNQTAASAVGSTAGIRKGKSNARSRKPTAIRNRKRSPRRKAPPKWILPLFIATMFIILVTVLTVVSYLIQKKEPPKESRQTDDRTGQKTGISNTDFTPRIVPTNWVA